MRRLAPVLGLAAALLLGRYGDACRQHARRARSAAEQHRSGAGRRSAHRAPACGAAGDPTGNPLWAIPLSSLTATRERPIFLPSRRAPAPAVANTPVVVAAPPPPPAAEPEQPPLVLVGVIAGDSEGFAVFLDQATNNVVRLKTGQDYQGWMLRSVKGREVTLEKNKRTTTLALPAPNADMAAAPRLHRRPCSRARAGRDDPTNAGACRSAASTGSRAPAGAPAAAAGSSGARAIPGDPRPLEDQL